MKLVYVLLACALVTMNSAFAMFDEEGPYCERDELFCLKKKTVLKHFDSSKPNDLLIIGGCEYYLRGSIRGDTGVAFRADSSIQWIVFVNYAPPDEERPCKPCKHWSYFLRLCCPNKIDAVNLEIHKVSDYKKFSVIHLKNFNKPYKKVDPAVKPRGPHQ